MSEAWRQGRAGGGGGACCCGCQEGREHPHTRSVSEGDAVPSSTGTGSAAVEGMRRPARHSSVTESGDEAQAWE